MSGSETVRFEVNDGLATITLARPDKRNAMSPEVFTDLGDAAERAAEDPDVRGVLIAGDGPSFCAGIDLNSLGALAGLQGSGFRSFVRVAQRPYRVIARMEKPTVAAVQGHAIGAGFQLALACDLRVGAEDAKFGMLEGKYGLIPDLGGSHHLARLVGPARAKELVWSARMIEADEALAIGLLQRMVPEGELLKQAEETLRAVTAFSPVTTALTKSLIDRATETPLEVEFEREAHAQTAAVQSEDHREAVAAFLERRAPRFKGR